MFYYNNNGASSNLNNRSKDNIALIPHPLKLKLSLKLNNIKSMCYCELYKFHLCFKMDIDDNAYYINLTGKVNFYKQRPLLHENMKT